MKILVNIGIREVLCGFYCLWANSIEGIDRMNSTINRWRAMHMFDQEKTGKCRVLQPESGGPDEMGEVDE